MKIKQVFKLKCLYLLNKNTIFILLINLILLIILLLISSLNIEKSLSFYERVEQYLVNSFLYIKLLMTFFSVYLFSYSISFKNDFLIYLLIPNNVKRSESIITTIILNLIISLILFWIIFICFSYIGLINTNFYIKEDYIITFISIYLIVNIYGLYSFLLMQIFKNFFSIIIMMTLFIITENISNDYSELYYKIVLLIIPNINENGNYFISNIYLVYLSIILINLNVIIYNNRDLNF